MRSSTVKIGIVMQVVGILACIGAGVVTALVLGFILEKTIGLKVTEDEQADGLDQKNWDIAPAPNGTPAE